MAAVAALLLFMQVASSTQVHAFHRHPHPTHSSSTHHLRSKSAENCTIGVDLATPASQSAFECMRSQHGIQHASIRAFQSNCYLDPHAVDSIHAAWAAGLIVDIYIFPSVGCTLSAVQQIDVTLDHLAKNNVKYRRVWLDVENWAWWPPDQCQRNLEWFRPMIAHLIKRVGEPRVGIYTSLTQWNDIMCNTSEWNHLDLWWPRWSQTQTFEDFKPFGGWDLPIAKQYAPFGPGCLVNVDMDWRPSGDCGMDEETARREGWIKDSSSAPSLPMPDKPSSSPQSSSSSSPSPSAVTPRVPRPPTVNGAKNCTIGVDLATPVSATAFECIIQDRGAQFLVVRAFQSNCWLDPHTVDTIKAAWAAGMSGVDVYFFPSNGCVMDPIQQFDATLQHLSENAATFNRMYFDVEDWAWDPQANCQDNIDWFMPLFLHAQDVLGKDRVGIYTVSSMWNRITCNSTRFDSALLWYAHWDAKPTTSDYTQIGGWTKPHTKQFTGNDHSCGVNLDMDYRPSGEC